MATICKTAEKVILYQIINNTKKITRKEVSFEVAKETNKHMRKTFSITKPIAIYPGTNMNGTPNRRLVIAVKPNELADMPEELFAMKRSQSKDMNRRGKLVFKYLSYKTNEVTPWSDRAASSFDDATPLSTVKEAVMSILTDPDAKAQFTVRMPGKFGKIKTPDGVYDLFDFTETPDGNLGYYLKKDTLATVTFTLAEHQDNEYYRLKLETDLYPEDIFEESGKGKRFGSGNTVSQSKGVFDNVVDDDGVDEDTPVW